MCSNCFNTNDWTAAFHLGKSVISDDSRHYIGSTAQGSSGNALVDGVISGTKWNGLTVSYNFPNSAALYGNVVTYDDLYYDQNGLLVPEKSNSPTHNFAQFTADMQTTARAAFTQVSSFTHMIFVEMATTAMGNTVDIALGQTTSTDTGFAYYPSSIQKGGDIWLGRGANFAVEGDQFSNPVLGDYNYMTFLHEIGHALGLKHAHEAGGIAGPVIANRDSMEFSLMSYRSTILGSLNGGYQNETYGYAQTFMMLDIAALQEMYGADYTTNGTDTIYSFNSATGEMLINGVGQGTPGANRIFRTIWDGNGNDTYDTSNYSENQNVSLAAGSWSLFSSAQRAGLDAGNFARANTYNALLIDNDTRSLIENAKTGAGADTLGGNQVNNILNGQGGDDKLVGHGGNDELIGGEGNDTLYGDFEPPPPPVATPTPPYTLGNGYSVISQSTPRNNASTAINLSNNASFLFDALLLKLIAVEALLRGVDWLITE